MSAGVSSRRAAERFVTAAAVAAASGVEDRVSGGISGSRGGCEDSSELPDEAVFPSAGHKDMADYIETGDNNTAIEEEMHGNLQTSTITNVTIAHTQQPTETALHSHNKLSHKTQQRRHQ